MLFVFGFIDTSSHLLVPGQRGKGRQAAKIPVLGIEPGDNGIEDSKASNGYQQNINSHKAHSMNSKDFITLLLRVFVRSKHYFGELQEEWICHIALIIPLVESRFVKSLNFYLSEDNSINVLHVVLYHRDTHSSEPTRVPCWLTNVLSSECSVYIFMLFFFATEYYKKCFATINFKFKQNLKANVTSFFFENQDMFLFQWRCKVSQLWLSAVSFRDTLSPSLTS